MDRFDTRRKKLRKRLRKCGADALLVTNFTNVTYLTGFTGDDSYLLVTKNGQVLLSDFRYITQLEAECPGLELNIRTSGVPMLDRIGQVVKQTKTSLLGFEASAMPVALRDTIAGKLTRTRLVPTTGLVEALRMIKDKSEIQQLRQSVWYAERAFGMLRSSIRPEQTEKEVANELEFNMRRLGAAGPGFASIVAVGPWAALPHATPGERRIGDDPLLLVDWGARGNLYRSDLTRVLVSGKISTKLRRVYGVVLKAQQKAIEAIRPGIAASEVDAAAREEIAKAGFGKNFGHGLGHGIGLDIHEEPRLSTTNHLPLRAGMVITVEPGIYLPGWGGVRIEDDVLVTATGHEVLTSVSKRLEDAVVDCSCC